MLSVIIAGLITHPGIKYQVSPSAGIEYRTLNITMFHTAATAVRGTICFTPKVGSVTCTVRDIPGIYTTDGSFCPPGCSVFEIYYWTRVWFTVTISIIVSCISAFWKSA